MDNTEGLDIEIRESEEHSLLLFTGALDMNAAAALHRAAKQLAASGRDVAIDWRGAGQIALTTLQVLLALKNALASRGRALRIVEDNPEIRAAIALAGLDALLPAANAA